MKSLNKKSYFSHILKSIDIYGSNINFTINKKIKSKTLVGGVLSLLSFILFIIYAIVNSNDLVYRLNPVVTRMEQYDKKYINIKNFLSIIPIAISYEGLEFEEILNYFDLYAFYEEYDLISKDFIIGKVVPLIKCSKDYFPNVSFDIYQKEISDNSYCLNASFLNETSLFYNNGIESVLTIHLGYCVEFLNPNCVTKEETMHLMNESPNQLTVSIGVSGILPLNYREPIQYFIKKFGVIPTTHYHKDLKIYLQEDDLETDDGLVFQNNKISKSFNIYESYSNFQIDNYDVSLVYIRIFPSNHSFYNKRVYTKIQDYLSQIGGIISLAFNIFPHLIYIFSIGRRDEKILNTLLELRNDNTFSSIQFFKKPNYTFDNNIQTVSKKINSNDDSSLNNINKSKYMKKNNFITKIHKRETNLFLKNYKNKTKIKFSNCELVKLYLCRCKCVIRKTKSKKLQLYHKYKVIIAQYLEVPFFIKKLEEQDKLKYILFNKEQLSLFKFIPNNFSYSDDFILKKDKLTLKKLFYNNDKEIANTLFTFLKNYDKSKTKNEIEKRLFQFFKGSVV